MKKILVPTDFSANSKAGIRFAIQWARHNKSELIFLHVLNVIRATRWTDAYINKLIKEEVEFAKAKLEKFVASICKIMRVKPGRYTCVVKDGTSAYFEIMEYCRKDATIDFICISTRGAGKIKKILGTNTGNLITKSTVPVMAVPKNYKVNPVKKVLYATDLRNYMEELRKVVDFANSFKASVEMFHLSWPDETFFDRDTFEKIMRRQFKSNIKLHIRKTDASHSLIYNLQNQIRISKPSVVIMFTDRNRTVFQKIFLSSKAEALSFQTKLPLLVFNKENVSKSIAKKKRSETSIDKFAMQ